MHISEVLEQANIVHDDKARRVLNTAPDKQAGISIKELEQGVTIERLEALTVPVYQYGTQITIHGTFDNVPDDLRVCGYKSLIKNQNGSLGVKYVAIDGAKKHLLAKAATYSKGNKYHVLIDSQGCELIKSFHSADNANDKIRLLECYNSTPDDLYIGGKRAVSLMYGGYAVIVDIGAIYESKLWELINFVTGIPNQLELDKLIKERELEYKIQSDKYDLERKLAQAKTEAQITEAKNNFKVPDNWDVFSGAITEAGIYADIKTHWGDSQPCLYVYQVKKFGSKLKINYKHFSDYNYIPWTPDGYKVWDKKSINGFRIMDNPQPIKPIKQTKQPQPITQPIPQGIAINHNEKLNGIEIKFPSKPDTSIISKLKELGFRWSQYNGIWYNRFNDNLFSQVTSLFNS